MKDFSFRTEENTTENFTGSLEADKKAVTELFSDSFDLIARDIETDGIKLCAVSLDGMCDELMITETVIKPVTAHGIKLKKHGVFTQISEELYKGVSESVCLSPDEAAEAVTGGNLILLAEGEKRALSFSVQGYPRRAVSEPQTEQNEQGSRESFTDNFKDNAALLRRRLRTPGLVIEKMTVGQESQTPVLICYLNGRAERSLTDRVKERISATGLDSVMGAGYLRAFLGGNPSPLFAQTGTTERPDVLAAKLTEGRVGIITDGTPFAIVVPYLFTDHFHTADDYLSLPAYTVCMRLLRLLCFITAATLPGLFTAACLFHPGLLPSDIMYDIAAAESRTPFPLMTEAVIIHLIYETVREAGLRMPAAAGQAVSIVGALVIGDAAVTAGLIGAPMLIIVALTAVCSSVVSKLHESVALLRFGFILAGGLTGFYGIMMLSGVLLVGICSQESFGVPFTASFSPGALRAKDGFLIKSRKKAEKPTQTGEMKY